GRVDVHVAAPVAAAAAGRPLLLHRPRGGGEPGHRQLHDPPGRGAGDPRAGAGALSMATDVRIPALGESVNEGVIVRWLKDDGALVRADEPLLELETEKATLEIPAQATGRLHIGQPVGARVEVGAVVGRIEEAQAASPADGG